MSPERRSALGRLVEQALDGGHRSEQLPLLRLAECSEQGAHIATRAPVELRERVLAGGGEGEVVLAGIVGGTHALDQPALRQTGQQAARVARIELEGAREIGGGEPIGTHQFPEQARFGRRKFRVRRAFVQHVDAADAEAVEAADGVDAGLVHARLFCR